MISRQDLKNDLLEIFSALDDLQYQYDWVITDHDIWYGKNCPDEVRKRWQWTGLLMTGEELTDHLSAGYIHFFAGGVVSAVPKGTKAAEVCHYEPYWANQGLFSAEYQFQTPLTQLELMCYDGYAWLIICEPALSKKICQARPQTKTHDEFYGKR